MGGGGSTESRDCRPIKNIFFPPVQYLNDTLRPIMISQLPEGKEDHNQKDLPIDQDNST